MIYENLIQENKAAFLAKLTEISAKLKVVPDWLMVVFKVEATDPKTGLINHRVVNPVSGATGLIQFMSSTAAGLGTSTFALRNMTNVQQLDYVYKYFQPYAGRIYSITDLYTITFFPVALGKPDDFVLQTAKISAGTIAAQNAAYDINKDKQITYRELKDSINSRVPSEAMIFLKKK